MSERINANDHNSQRDESNEMSGSEVHPLQHKWVLFHSSDGDWSTLRKISEFATVEDFWGLFEQMSQPSLMPVGTDIYIFKDGIAPSWTDPANKSGGRWIFNIDKQRSPDRADPCWLELMMACVGEQFSKCGDQVCGAVFSIRHKANRVILWVSDADDNQATYAIGATMKEKLHWTSKDGTFKFEAHRPSK